MPFLHGPTLLLGAPFLCDLAPRKHMCNASYWLHVTPAGVPVPEGLVGCHDSPQVAGGLPRNIIPPLPGFRPRKYFNRPLPKVGAILLISVFSLLPLLMARHAS